MHTTKTGQIVRILKDNKQRSFFILNGTKSFIK